MKPIFSVYQTVVTRVKKNVAPKRAFPQLVSFRMLLIATGVEGFIFYTCRRNDLESWNHDAELPDEGKPAF